MESVTCFDYITSLKIGPKWGVPVCVVAFGSHICHVKHCSILPMFEAALASEISYGQNDHKSLIFFRSK